MREQIHWYDCKLWKKLKQMGANDTTWGLQRALDYKKHPDGHYCSLSEREHEVIRKFDEKRKSGKLGVPMRFETVDALMEHLKSNNESDEQKVQT